MITDNDRKGVARAIEESSRSTFGRVKIGAIVLSKCGTTLGYGHNQRKTHPRQYAANMRVGKQIENPCIHAEIAALNDLDDHAWYYTGYTTPHTIYVARLDRNGKWANCRPCAACHSEIVAAGIKRVVYTTEEGVKEYACG
jgi:tRNA(Arg) A34 adenosine deaminase TadA